MMPFTDWVGLSGAALVWLLLALRLPHARRLDPMRRLLFVAAVCVAVMVPVAGLSLAGWLRGLMGDLSLTSLLLLGAALHARLRPQAAPVWGARERWHLLACLSVLALMLYPFALGLGTLDPYRSGYGSAGLIVMLALLALWALWRGLALLPLAIMLAAAGWSLAVFESTNLWDYLIDAPLAIYALSVTLGTLLRQAFRRMRA